MDTSTEEHTSTTKTEPETLKLLINGQSVVSQTSEFGDILNPANQELLARVPFATSDEIDCAVEAARRAYRDWSETPVSQRARVFLRLQHLLRENHDALALCLTREQGKTLDDAKGDVFRGIEVVEQAANIASLLMGETVSNVGRGIDTFSLHQPLGVCVGITPFNFPAMVPLWMFPMAIAAGNTFVLKPSERTPMTAMLIADLAQRAGLPPGVLNVVHGGAEVVQNLCEDPNVKAVSFVGSSKVGRAVHERASKHGKRCQALIGAKNHAVLMPDAHKGRAISSLIGAAFGASGQRCMAISVAVLVGEAREWTDDIVEKARSLHIGAGEHPSVDMGPLISPQAKERVIGLIDAGVHDGARLLLDGRHVKVPGFEHGNWVGPTIFSEVKPEMSIYQEEIFGPVLILVGVKDLDEAIELINANPHGNGSAIFTHSGHTARHFQHNIDVGMIGINIPIPVPLPFFSFSGAKGSIQGDLHAYGKDAVRFYTQTKTVTTRWVTPERTNSTPTTIHMPQ